MYQSGGLKGQDILDVNLGTVQVLTLLTPAYLTLEE